ncbi:hypothetical protein I588_04504 [Enterococcus pallens ATCC BAA-351]|uniref:Uncharacterized protein n=1 Tax=Enterococcus pallens ATCC BAA-351 TaxID=1158607 RepID=R2QEA7_9ENTE|nr:hypothetical protein UAU_01749 [Enterococcus pallens ATCC BAA-351]EOU14854.1 hypothetical protein I588_04504 [Enterococcus pallens ATCC BAA-351]
MTMDKKMITVILIWLAYKLFGFESAIIYFLLSTFLLTDFD